MYDCAMQVKVNTDGSFIVTIDPYQLKSTTEESVKKDSGFERNDIVLTCKTKDELISTLTNWLNKVEFKEFDLDDYWEKLQKE